MGLPFRYHWLPVALEEVRVTLPPEQNVVGPPAMTVGVAGAGPGVKSKKPETSPENWVQVVPPALVLTTTTKLDAAGTWKEYEPFGTVVPSAVMPLSPR